MWWKSRKKLTSQQEAQVSVTLDKWKVIAFSPTPTDRQKARLAVKSAYQLLGLAEPKIIFFHSHYRALMTLLEQAIKGLDNELISRIESQLSDKNHHELESETLRQLVSQIISPLQHQIQQEFGGFLEKRLENQFKTLLTKQPDTQFSKDVINQLEPQLKSLLNNQQLVQLVAQQENQLNSQLTTQLVNQLKQRMTSKAAIQRFSRLMNLLQSQQSSQLSNRLGNSLGRSLFYSNCIQSELWASQGSWFDFCISTLKVPYDAKKWDIFQSLVSHTGWIVPYEKTCIISDRPIKVCFDHEHRLHAEGEYALMFADGYRLYFHHGVVLPTKYGTLHPHQWLSEWILEEDNAELRRILIQEIGYERICQELDATELESWREYTLVRLDKIIDDIDGQPVHLLKMTCPSTKFIHTLRVPPNIKSARAAIRWINWGVDPEQFSLQS